MHIDVKTVVCMLCQRQKQFAEFSDTCKELRLNLLAENKHKKKKQKLNCRDAEQGSADERLQGWKCEPGAARKPSQRVGGEAG